MWKLPTIVAILLLPIACHCSTPVSGKQFVPAKLVQASEFKKCEYYCTARYHPTTEYCFHIGDTSIVGEGGGFLWMGEDAHKSLRDQVGNELPIWYDNSSIWIQESNGTIRKIKRGTQFEGFKDAGCVVAVHQAKLAKVPSSERPANLPNGAFALPAAAEGDMQRWQTYLWFSCSMNISTATIDCRKWTPSGLDSGYDHYCARTTDGAKVPANFRIDRLVSREHRIILTTGQALVFDARARTNNILDQPAQPCHGPDAQLRSDGSAP